MCTELIIFGFKLVCLTTSHDTYTHMAYSYPSNGSPALYATYEEDDGYSDISTGERLFLHTKTLFLFNRYGEQVDRRSKTNSLGEVPNINLVGER